MERLTEWENGSVTYNEKREIECGEYCDSCSQGAGNCETIKNMIKKLADYEDLEEQGLLLKLPCKEVYSKSGDEVYLIFEDEIIECIHCGLDICGSDGEGYIILGAYEDIFPYRDPDPEHDLDPTDWCRNTNHVSLSEIGKTLFFTREEAKKKLEEMKNE
nr:MAG: hypothetical protein [Bacteriophage sp.]UWF92484.1 MAG: hypothetical protein [Bacteriophage sp.]UWG14239.1 MAG: hypothetical protein [Bacteriophage sp.]